MSDTKTSEDGLIYDPQLDVDPLGDQEELEENNTAKNYAKVGSSRGSTLMYTYGPGSIMDLPHFTVMPMGLDAWNKIWKRRPIIPKITAPRLLENVQIMLGNQVKELRPFPWQPNQTGAFREGSDLGVPARVFPQWLRCTGCNMLAPVSDFVNGYSNTNPYRPDQAEFMHKGCRGSGKGAKRYDRPCVPARYLLVCEDGHVDEFPYGWWVHRGNHCPQASKPLLKMIESTTGVSGSLIKCVSCGAERSMLEAQSLENRSKLPRCRGRLAHLDAFQEKPCDKPVRLMLIGASNLWFPVVQSIIDMPRLDEKANILDEYNMIRTAIGSDVLCDMLLKKENLENNIETIRKVLESSNKVDDELKQKSEVELRLLIIQAQQSEMNEDERQQAREQWEPSDLLVPEWKYLVRDFPDTKHVDRKSGLAVHVQQVHDAVADLGVKRILAVDKLKKVNALIGFTRVDDFDRINDLGSRLVSLKRDSSPTWVPATEDYGEGIFIQFDEEQIEKWENAVLANSLWDSHVKAHRRNFRNRLSETAATVDPDTRLPKPRYWLMHTLSHALIKRMAMSAGYGIASLSERIYAWQGSEDRPAAAGVLIETTAAGSDGTLGGLVDLSNTDKFEQIMTSALQGMKRCSSDPVCARRIPKDPEDFLHGAACHCCCMLSETSCERANRFLDRRFLVPLPGQDPSLAFFKD